MDGKITVIRVISEVNRFCALKTIYFMTFICR